MLGGVKFIPRDQIDKENDAKKGKKSCGSKEKHRTRKKSSHYSSSDDELERIKKRSKKKQKWYSSEEDFSSYSSGSESNGSLDQDRRKHGKKKKNKRAKDSSSDEAFDWSKNKSRDVRRQNSSENDFSSSFENESDGEDKRKKGSEKERKKSGRKGNDNESAAGDSSGDGRGSLSLKDKEIVRKEMGLEWMLRPQEKLNTRPSTTVDNTSEEAPIEDAAEIKVNPRELNPYLRNNGSGYPEDADGGKASGEKLLSSSVVGDGGASWRLKALKRAQEQAAREGRKLEEIVEERWGSVGQLAVSAASRMAAAPRAHLHAIKSRQKGIMEEQKSAADDGNGRGIKKKGGKDYLHNVSSRHPEMRAPRVRESVSWGKRRSQNIARDAGVISAAASSLNKFTDDGNFMQQFLKKSDDPDASGSSLKDDGTLEPELALPNKDNYSESSASVEGLSANQLAAKALQLRMKGKHAEAERLLKEAENLRTKLGSEDNSVRPVNEGSTRRYTRHDVSIQQKKKDDDVDMHLARRIVQNKQFSISGQADEEYDFDDGPQKKPRRKGGSDSHKVNPSISKRLLTQQERCLFCFENPDRPKHLVVSIANFTYLMLPKWQQVVPGHCCILPMQHESATRNIDNNVWEEIRNFKKCLIMMFSKQEKELVFLETVMGLAQQRRHCLIECIPLPREIAKQAPLYFKKAIDEAEDEWSQHNAKKLIDTSEKGLRGSIPKNFPYFHVEFGLNRGFVHVIDDEKQFKSSLGLNVVRGMLQLPEEDMYRRRRYESIDAQREAVTSFAREWEPFDWTKQLE